MCTQYARSYCKSKSRNGFVPRKGHGWWWLNAAVTARPFHDIVINMRLTFSKYLKKVYILTNVFINNEKHLERNKDRKLWLLWFLQIELIGIHVSKQCSDDNDVKGMPLSPYRLLRRGRNVCPRQLFSPMWRLESWPINSMHLLSLSAFLLRWSRDSSKLLSSTILPETATLSSRFSTLWGLPEGTKRTWPAFKVTTAGDNSSISAYSTVYYFPMSKAKRLKNVNSPLKNKNSSIFVNSQFSAKTTKLSIFRKVAKLQKSITLW